MIKEAMNELRGGLHSLKIIPVTSGTQEMISALGISHQHQHRPNNIYHRLSDKTNL